MLGSGRAALPGRFESAMRCGLSSVLDEVTNMLELMNPSNVPMRMRNARWPDARPQCRTPSSRVATRLLRMASVRRDDLRIPPSSLVRGGRIPIWSESSRPAETAGARREAVLHRGYGVVRPVRIRGWARRMSAWRGRELAPRRRAVVQGAMQWIAATTTSAAPAGCRLHATLMGGRRDGRLMSESQVSVSAGALATRPA